VSEHRPETDDAARARDAAFAAYASDREDARFSAWLRERTGSAWSEAVEHEFVRELDADALEDAVFRRYLVQDYAFVRELTGAFGHAVGEAPTTAARSTLVDFLGTLTAQENDYFERTFDALDVPESAYDEPALAEPTRAFVDLLGRASAGGYPELLAVLAPAEWAYRDWASGVADPGPETWYLEEWVELHDDPAFDEFVSFLRAELDREGAAAGPRRRRRLADLFERTVDLEVAFFDAAYDAAAGTPERDGDLGAASGGGRGW